MEKAAKLRDIEVRNKAEVQEQSEKKNGVENRDQVGSKECYKMLGKSLRHRGGQDDI